MIFVWPICLNNFHPDTNRLQLWFMLCAQQISVLLLMVSAQISPGSLNHNPRNSINLSTSLILPPKWVLFTDPCFTRYKKSLSDSQRAPSTPQHPTAQKTQTHTHTLTHSSTAPWKHLKGQNLVDIQVFRQLNNVQNPEVCRDIYTGFKKKSEYNMGIVKSLIRSKHVDWWYSIIEDISNTTFK